MGPQTSYFSKANLPKIRPKPFRLLFISNLHPTPHGGGIEEPDEMCKTSWFKTNSSTKRCFTSPNMPGLGVESLTGQPGPSRILRRAGNGRQESHMRESMLPSGFPGHPEPLPVLAAHGPRSPSATVKFSNAGTMPQLFLRPLTLRILTKNPHLEVYFWNGFLSSISVLKLGLRSLLAQSARVSAYPEAAVLQA
ncbi:uncharacterized protein LOC103667688 isoform X2 [Ursus maritimus]|uniref:Uncharacterized protein LOC103667688 isoform X2 n=1 Tax=Ursus maritimus TaxID=29073 RepID=A0A8M1G905_URSMA|nr:uncharacterized protein LOC103667688 isoform X2 [Ursus maritimus]